MPPRRASQSAPPERPDRQREIEALLGLKAGELDPERVRKRDLRMRAAQLEEIGKTWALMSDKQ
jgi:putative heme degradation protein